MPTLFDPLQVGALRLPNRIIMAPLTRARAGVKRVPNQLMADYYVQRADAGMIISEATSVTPMGVGYADTPGIWSDEQVEGWKIVTSAVHAAGGRMLLQLWHVGRVSDPMFLNGELPVAPSAIAPSGHVSLVRPQKAFVTPRALDIKEIPAIVDAYRTGAINAKRAGFDGVEVHGANGYLLDQFLQDGSNKRTDRYGGPIENRARLMLEVTDAAIEGRIGPQLKKIFGGVYIANEGFTLDSANAALEAGEADAVAFGKQFIANPDLVQRFEQRAPLNTPDTSTFYAPGEKGYVDYPLLAELESAS
jgi:2,4-dienoyl-CoA reductase-like NADH-dependent reductase (Old Yellow Enzyme family)